MKSNMEAPKEIYLNQVPVKDQPDIDLKIWTHNPQEGYESVKYIRADLAELDWVDVSIMDETLHNVLEQEKIHIEQGPASYYEEVLRRFNKYKEERNNKHDHC